MGLDAAFGLADSTSPQAIELELRVAIAEFNAAGGVLGGRPLERVTRDRRSMPARGLQRVGRLLDSAPAAGTCFHIDLPLLPAQAAAAAVPAAAAGPATATPRGPGPAGALRRRRGDAGAGWRGVRPLPLPRAAGAAGAE